MSMSFFYGNQSKYFSIISALSTISTTKATIHIASAIRPIGVFGAQAHIQAKYLVRLQR